MVRRAFVARCTAIGSIVCLVSGCSTVVSRTRRESNLLRTEVRDTAPSGDRLSASRWRFDGDALLVDVDRWRWCHREEVRVYQLTDVTDRRIVKDHRLLAGLTALAAGVSGALIVADPEGFASDEDENGEPVDPEESADNARTIGYGLLGVAGLAALIVVVDSVRSGTDRVDRGVKRVPTGSRDPFACDEDAGTTARLTLELPGGDVRTAEAGAQGGFRFALGTPSPTVAAGEHTAWLSTDDRREPVSLMLWPTYAEAVMGLDIEQGQGQ